jgi:hypothetical protein
VRKGRVGPSASSSCEVAVIEELVCPDAVKKAQTGTGLLHTESICVKFTVAFFNELYEAHFPCNLIVWRG